MTKKSLKAKSIYFIGIKGVGMTMLAQFLAAQGNKISGSDNPDTFLTDKVLRTAGIKIQTPFSPSNLPSRSDMIIYSSAYNVKNNPELAFIKNNPARFKAVRVLSYAEALGQIFNEHEGIAVCGSHGKTTTSAWLGYVLWLAGTNPVCRSLKVAA
jgi:UDP-N-acetylmuramate--alanine ligase